MGRCVGECGARRIRIGKQDYEKQDSKEHSSEGIGVLYVRICIRSVLVGVPPPPT